MAQPKLQRIENHSDNMNDFKQIFEDNKKNVFAMALSVLRDFELAEDVLQEVFIKLFQHMKHQEISNTKAWLISVSRNTALDLYRKKKRELTGFTDDYFESMPYLAGDPLDRLVLKKYLEILDEHERQIIILKEISGMKHREIAKIMEMPLGTVLWKYNKALKKTKKRVLSKGEIRWKRIK